MSREASEANNIAPGPSRTKRKATVYDAVAGRIGTNGFISVQDLAGSSAALTPDEVLRRKTSLSESGHDENNQPRYNLGDAEDNLPDSDLLKAIHAYASDFYSRTTADHGANDFSSLDGTALIAIGCLLEETMEKVLGENGDMVLVEPRSFENGLPDSSLTKHQVHGRVKPPPTPPPIDDDTSESDDKPAKKRRR